VNDSAKQADAPNIQLSGSVEPAKRVTPVPIKQYEPIVTGLLFCFDSTQSIEGVRICDRKPATVEKFPIDTELQQSIRWRFVIAECLFNTN